MDNHELLPDFARKTGGQQLNFIDRFGDLCIVVLLNVEGGNFAGERKQFAAVVRVATQFKWRRFFSSGVRNCSLVDGPLCSRISLAKLIAFYFAFIL